MSAQQTDSYGQSIERGFAPPEGERLAKVIPFPVQKGVGGLAVGASSESGIAVRQGSGSERYLTRQQIPSVVPHSSEYHARARELGNRVL